MPNNQVSRAQAATIASTVIGALSYLPTQFRDDLIESVTTYIQTQGGQARKELQRYVSDQISGIADYVIGNGITRSQLQQDIRRAGTQLAAQAQQAATRARERGDLSAEGVDYDRRRERHQELANEYGERQIMGDEDYDSMVQREVTVSDQLMGGKSLFNLHNGKHR